MNKVIVIDELVNYQLVNLLTCQLVNYQLINSSTTSIKLPAKGTTNVPPKIVGVISAPISVLLIQLIQHVGSFEQQG